MVYTAPYTQRGGYLVVTCLVWSSPVAIAINSKTPGAEEPNPAHIVTAAIRYRRFRDTRVECVCISK